MEISLQPAEIRILGVLIEKQMATPDYYPMTLNALVNGCNQKNNREPVMALDQQEVEQALHALRQQHLVWQIMTTGSRVAKYEHNLSEIIGISDREQAFLCELFLRGPQTVGELNTRVARLIETHGLIAVEQTLKKLAEHSKGPFVRMLPRRPGQKENRYTHLFCPVEASEAAYQQEGEIQEGLENFKSKNDAVEALEKRIADLETRLSGLSESFESFRRQFE